MPEKRRFIQKGHVSLTLCRQYPGRGIVSIALISLMDENRKREKRRKMMKKRRWKRGRKLRRRRRKRRRRRGEMSE